MECVAAVSRTLFSFGTKEDEKKAIQEAEKYVKRYYREHDMLTTMVAPHSPYTCSTEMLEECARIAMENNTMVHIHLSETEREVQDIEKQYGKRPVEYIEVAVYLRDRQSLRMVLCSMKMSALS